MVKGRSVSADCLLLFTPAPVRVSRTGRKLFMVRETRTMALDFLTFKGSWFIPAVFFYLKRFAKLQIKPLILFSFSKTIIETDV